MNDLISIIVPVYKVEPYLRKCLDSIIEQTYKNIEIILVDDGSPDDCGIICDEYAEKDSRIKIYHTENHGIAAARNFGIEKANGEYIMFADSDDWVEPDFCRIPYETAVSHNADLVMFQFNHGDLNGNSVRKNPALKEGVVDKFTAIDLMFFSGISWAAWNRLYKKVLFKEIRYPEGRYYEDTGTTHKLVMAAERICVIDDALYNYRQGRDGSITQYRDRKHVLDFLDMHRQRAEYLRGLGYPEEKNEFYEAEAAMTYLLYTKRRKGDQDREWCRRILKKTGVLRSEHSDRLTAKGRILLRLFKMSSSVFDLVCFITGKRRA